MKIGYLGTGLLDCLDVTEFAAWGAESGFQALDVRPKCSYAPQVRARYGLATHSTYGPAANPITGDDQKRRDEIAKAAQAIESAAKHGVACGSS